MHSRPFSCVVVVAALSALVGCRSEAPPERMRDRPTTGSSNVPFASATAESPVARRTFASPPDALAALAAAVKSGERSELRAIYGPAPRELLSGDPVEDDNDFKSFMRAAQEHLEVEVPPGSESGTVYVGAKRWPSPIPLVRAADGQWSFDLGAGVDKLLARRIGSNELRTIEICRDFVTAQRDYASADRDGDGVLQYAQHFISTPGKRDGLYWDPADGAGASPFGPEVAAAADEGYHPRAGVRSPYHGYYLHSLHAQGPHAPGGQYSYLINGRQIAGFAMIAYPAKYGSSGVMTFLVNHQGRVYQKDLGLETVRLAQGMTAYDPDPTWSSVRE